MKIIHVADLHLNGRLDAGFSFEKDRIKERWQLLKRLMTICNEESIDLLLMCGDIFDKNPNEVDLGMLCDCFHLLSNTQVIMTAGNHDTLKKDSPYYDYKFPRYVRFIKSKEVTSLVLKDLGVRVYGHSYYSWRITEPMYDNLRPVQDGLINIFAGHGGDESHIPINKQKLAKAGFDYVALGHIHTPAIYEEYRMAYSGSFVPTNLSELGERGYMRVDICDDTTKIRFVPLAKSLYKQIGIDVSGKSLEEIQRQAKQAIQADGGKNQYIIVLIGDIALEAQRGIDELLKLDRVVKLDKRQGLSIPYEKLLDDNYHNLLGRFIDYFNDSDDIDSRLALEYGVMAFLGRRRLDYED